MTHGSIRLSAIYRQLRIDATLPGSGLHGPLPEDEVTVLTAGYRARLSVQLATGATLRTAIASANAHLRKSAARLAVFRRGVERRRRRWADVIAAEAINGVDGGGSVLAGCRPPSRPPSRPSTCSAGCFAAAAEGWRREDRR